MDRPSHKYLCWKVNCGIIPFNNLADRQFQVRECCFNDRHILIVKLKVCISNVGELRLADDNTVFPLIFIEEKSVRLTVLRRLPLLR